MQNCRWEGTFQRLLIMPGPGLVRGNTFTRTGGPAMSLIGIQESLIERNHIDSPVRASVIAKRQDEMRRRAIVMKHSRSVTVKANTLHVPENYTQPDAVSGSRVLGLEATKEITLDGEKVPDAPALTKPRSKK